MKDRDPGRLVPTNHIQAEALRATKEAFLAALARVGTLSAACDAAGKSRTWYRHWYDRDASFRDEVAVAMERYRDMLKSAAVARATGRQTRQVIYKGQAMWQVDPETQELRRDAEGKPVPLMEPVFSDRLMEKVLEEADTRTFARTVNANAHVRVERAEADHQQIREAVRGLSQEERRALAAMLDMADAGLVATDAEFEEVTETTDPEVGAEFDFG